MESLKQTIMTPEEEAEVERLAELYTESVEGRTLQDIVPDTLYIAFGLGMARILIRTASALAQQLRLDPEAKEILYVGQAIGVGILLAELGKTRLLKLKEVVQ